MAVCTMVCDRHFGFKKRVVALLCIVIFYLTGGPLLPIGPAGPINPGSPADPLYPIKPWAPGGPIDPLGPSSL